MPREGVSLLGGGMRRGFVALFGEAERGEYQTAHHCRSLEDLAEFFGEPPPDSRGLHFAVQVLLYQRPLIFFRVPEEGFSRRDYLLGLEYLKGVREQLGLMALGLPGVGDAEIIEASMPICEQHRSLLIVTEADLYDYLTSAPLENDSDHPIL